MEKNTIKIIIFYLFVIRLRSVFCYNDFIGESPIFEHGTVITSSSKLEKDNDFSNSEKISVGKSEMKKFHAISNNFADSDTMRFSKPPKFRPLTKTSIQDMPSWNYVSPTSPTAEKISLLKTYFDPVTKQPYRYVMRKKTEFKDDEDSFMNTATKIFNQLIGSDGIYTSNPEYNNHKIGGYLNPGISGKHIHKREIPDEDGVQHNETSWLPIFVVKQNISSNDKTVTKNLIKKQSDGNVERDDGIHYGFHENQGKFAYQSEKRDGSKAFVIEKLQSIESETKEKRAEEENINNTSFGRESLNGYNLNLQNSKILKGLDNFTDDSFIDDENPSAIMESIKIVQKLFINCKHKTKHFEKDANFIFSMQSCIQMSVLRALDRMLKSKIVPLSDNIILVRDGNSSINGIGPHVAWNPSAKDLKGNSDYIAAVCERMFRMLQSHSLQIKLWNTPDDIVEGRRRHHYRKAFPMMVAGYMMLSAFLVPLGFQFMAMIGGKALLLSKMALMMSMLGGFKKLLQPEPVFHSLPSYDLHSGGSGWHHRSTHEPMTMAYTKNNYGGYNALQRDLHNTQQWIDPKSYSVLK